MFDIENKELIGKIIDMRNNNQIIIPLYVKVYNETFPILELENMTIYNPSAFKIGFGTSISILGKNNFPRESLLEFDPITAFTLHDQDTGESIRYMVFESSDVDDTNSELYSQIHAYYQLLSNKVKDIVKVYKSTLLDF